MIFEPDFKSSEDDVNTSTAPNPSLESHYRHIIDHSLDGILLTHPDGDIYFANPAACRLLGLTEADLVRRGWQALIAPGENGLDRAFASVEATGQFLGPMKLMRNGTGFPAEISVSEFKTPDGQTQLSVIVRDMTAGKEMEAHLKETESRYHMLFEHIDSGVVIYEVKQGGRDFIIKNMNRSGERLLRTNREDIIVKSAFDVWPGIGDFGLIDYFKKALTTGRAVFFPAARYRDDLLDDWFENRVYPLPSGEIVAVFNKVTEQRKAYDALRESESRFRTVIEATSDGLILLSSTSRILAWNRGAEIISGLRAKDLVGKTVASAPWQAVHEDGTPCALADLPAVKTLNTGRPVTDMVLGLYRPSGELRWVTTSTQPLFTPDGALHGVVGSFSDITAIQKAQHVLETEIDKRTGELRDVNAALEILLKKREQDIKDLEERIVSNYDSLILPVLARIKSCLRDTSHQPLIQVLEKNLRDILSPFSQKLSDPMERLTPAEIQIASMIRQGLSSKEIAQALNNSVRTITHHRENIREKLGLRNRKVNLRTYLSSL